MAKEPFAYCKACLARVKPHPDEPEKWTTCLMPDNHRAQGKHVWKCDFLVGGKKGDRLRPTFKEGTTKEEAWKFQIKRLSEFDDGKYITKNDSKITVLKVLEKYEREHIQEKSRHSNGAAKYYLKVLKGLLGHISAVGLTLAQISEAMSKFKEETESSNANVNKCFVYLKAAFQYCFNHGFIARHSADYIPFLPTTPTSPRFLDQEERKKVWAEFRKDERVEENAIAISHSAIRPIDLRLMEWPQVDFERRRIRITTYKGQEPRVVYHPIDDEMFRLLKKRYEKTGGKGKVFNWQYRHQLVEDMIKRAGVNDNRPEHERFTFYGLKHIYISDLVNKGIRIELVSEITNVSIPTLKKHYLKIDNQVLLDAQAKVNSVPEVSPQRFEVI